LRLRCCRDALSHLPPHGGPILPPGHHRSRLHHSPGHPRLDTCPSQSPRGSSSIRARRLPRTAVPCGLIYRRPGPAIPPSWKRSAPPLQSHRREGLSALDRRAEGHRVSHCRAGGRSSRSPIASGHLLTCSPQSSAAELAPVDPDSSRSGGVGHPICCAGLPCGARRRPARWPGSAAGYDDPRRAVLRSVPEAVRCPAGDRRGSARLCPMWL